VHRSARRLFALRVATFVCVWCTPFPPLQCDELFRVLCAQIADLSGPISFATNITGANTRGHRDIRTGIFGGSETSRRFSVVHKYNRWPEKELVRAGDKAPAVNSSSLGSVSGSSGGLRRVQAAAHHETVATTAEGVVPSVSLAHAHSASASVSAADTSPVAHHAHNSNTQICAKYMGTIGGDWPTVQVD
jgi:hypothetical protein